MRKKIFVHFGVLQLQAYLNKTRKKKIEKKNISDFEQFNLTILCTYLHYVRL